MFDFYFTDRCSLICVHSVTDSQVMNFLMLFHLYNIHHMLKSRFLQEFVSVAHSFYSSMSPLQFCQTSRAAYDKKRAYVFYLNSSCVLTWSHFVISVTWSCASLLKALWTIWVYLLLKRKARGSTVPDECYDWTCALLYSFYVSVTCLRWATFHSKTSSFGKVH